MARGSAVTEIGRAPTDVFAVLADVTKNAGWASASIEGSPDVARSSRGRDDRP